MITITKVIARPDFRLWIRFADGTEGEADLRELSGKKAFAAWRRPGGFEKVEIGAQGELRWGDQLDLCPDSLYLRITGKRPEDIYPSLKTEAFHA